MHKIKWDKIVVQHWIVMNRRTRAVMSISANSVMSISANSIECLWITCLKRSRDLWRENRKSFCRPKAGLKITFKARTTKLQAFYNVQLTVLFKIWEIKIVRTSTRKTSVGPVIHRYTEHQGLDKIWTSLVYDTIHQH